MALPDEACDVSRQDLLVVRARLACRVANDLPSCAQALVAAGFLRIDDKTDRDFNERHKIEAALADDSPTGVLNITLSEWAGERARLLQPELSKAKLILFMEMLPGPSPATSRLDLAARAGLRELIASSANPQVPTETTAFWLRNMSFEPTSLAIILEPSLTPLQTQIIENLLSNQGQVVDVKNELARLHWNGTSAQSTFWTRSVLTHLADGMLKKAKQVGLGSGESIARIWGHESLPELGQDLASRFSATTLRVAQSNSFMRFFMAPLVSLARHRAVQFVGAKGLAFIISSFEPPGLLFAAVELTLKPTNTGCDTLDVVAIPVDRSCYLTPDDETHSHVLSFLDSVVSNDPKSWSYAKFFLNHPITCNFYRDLNEKTRTSAQVVNLACRSDRVQSQVTVSGVMYDLDIGIYPVDSRNPRGIRQITATIHDHFSLNENRAVNWLFNSDGTEGNSVNGVNDEIAGAIRISALRAVNACSHQPSRQ